MKTFMKCLTVAAIFSTISINAHAGLQEDIELCTNASIMASSIMLSVQNDRSLDDLLKSRMQSGNDLGPLITAMYANAMEQQRMRSDDGKIEQLKDFKHLWFNVCMKDKSKVMPS